MDSSRLQPPARTLRGIGPGHRRRLRWLAFALGAFAAVGGLAWVTRAVLALERDQAEARAETARAEKIRLALWRLDSWMAPRLAAEAARPYFHYLALYPPRRAYDQFLSPIAAGEVLTPSPLLAFRDEVVRLHVQVNGAGDVTSPQVPENGEWSASLTPLASEPSGADAARLLDRAREDLGGVPLVRRVEEVVACQTLAIADDPQSDTAFVSELLDKLNNRAPTQWSTHRAAEAPAEANRSKAEGLVPPSTYVENSRLLADAALVDATLAAPAVTGAGSKGQAGPAAVRSADAARELERPRQAAAGAAGAGEARDQAPRALTRQPQAPSTGGDDRKEAGADLEAGLERALVSKGTEQKQTSSDAARGNVAPVPAEPQSAGDGQRRRQASKASDVQSQSRGPASNDYAKRLIQSNAAQVASPIQVEQGPGEPMVEVGPFVPLWVAHGEDAPALYYFRRVAVGSAELAQGFLVDWPTLVASLREQIVDLLPEATIEPVGLSIGTGLASSIAATSETATDETRLASIPARLVPGPCPEAAMPSGLTPTRATLGAAWIALLAAIVAAAFSLQAVAADAERRTRFAGVVTHELRTPLTTFQLYTDMLVDGMVPPENRGEYLVTLRDESHRLGHLVENVLSYARIEQGRYTAKLEEVTAAELLARIEHPLRRRAEAAGFEFRVETEVSEAGRRFRIDTDGVERILFNLVDNAAKYALHSSAIGGRACASGDGASEAPGTRGSDEATPADDPSARADAGPPTLVLRVEQLDGTLQLAVVDHGPGVPAPQRSRLFQPFERGTDDHTQQQRGIGLGLALSRELARALGGDLRHEPTPGGGATFRLVVG